MLFFDEWKWLVEILLRNPCKFHLWHDDSEFVAQTGNYVICKGSDETVACRSEISGWFAFVAEHGDIEGSQAIGLLQVIDKGGNLSSDQAAGILQLLDDQPNLKKAKERLASKTIAFGQKNHFLK